MPVIMGAWFSTEYEHAAAQTHSTSHVTPLSVQVEATYN